MGDPPRLASSLCRLCSTPMRGPWILLIFVLLLFFLSHVTGVSSYLSFENLKDNHHLVREVVQRHPKAATLAYILVYTVIVACSIPGATVLTLGSGVIFDQPYATIYSVVGAATGACILFYVARTTFGEFVASRISSATISKLREYLQTERKQLIVTMLLLRLVPIFPFFLINIVPSLLGVDTTIFILTTYIGIIPGSWVYSECGVSLATILSDDTLEEDLQLNSFLRKALLRPDMLASLTVLGTWTMFLIVLYIRVSYAKGKGKEAVGKDE